MACFHPLRAWRTPSGNVVLNQLEGADYTPLRLPCGGCLGCRLAYAQAWALRCQLELQRHEHAVFTTLTYDDAHVPVTLPKPSEAVPLWVKRLRKHKGAKSVRFYASAEYGERTNRPHFHALLYGMSENDAQLIEEKWPFGHTRTERITPARIAYTAGYCHKKTDYKHIRHERVDPATGEVYMWEPPYKLMSRNPGIGGHARAWLNSWRLYAIKDGHKMAVPRYLHEAWKLQATAQEKENLENEKLKLSLVTDSTPYTLNAAKKIKEKQQEINHQKRNYL